MRILEIRFKNLNSLYGEWGIDFTTPEYVFDGIFAITGPTGAGKSTILDAVCLALYGRTPRLKSIAKSSNEIMSRQTGECFAEAVFETPAGSFQCHWGQHKARKKADGNLTDSKHEIADAKTGQILASKKRDVAKRVEQVTGMDFDRFTRSMMLAQGGFAAFLAAGSDQRAPILEQMTGTKIYSEISKGVHERQRSEQKKLELLQAQTDGISILSDEDEAAFNTELRLKQKNEKQESLKKEALGKSILWLTGIETLKKDLEKIDKESEAISKELSTFLLDREKLQDALKAADLENIHATLVSARQQQANDLKDLAASEILVPGKETILARKETDFKKRQAAYAKAREEQKKGLGLIQKVRAIDLYISEKQTVLENARTDCQKIQNQVSQKKDLHQKAIQNHETAGQDLAGVEAYLSVHTLDASLVTDFTGINEKIHHLQRLVRNSQEIENLVLNAKKQFSEETARLRKQEIICAKFRENQGIANKEVEQAKKAIKTLLAGRLLREYRADHEGLLREMAYLRKIASLENERSRLEDGKPCLVCGALHHPFAQGNIPQNDTVEEKINTLSSLIKKTEKLETDQKVREDKEKETVSVLLESEKQLVRDLQKKDDALARVQRLEKEQHTLSKDLTELKNSITYILTPLGIKEIKEDNLDSISGDLKTRQEKWQAHQKQKAEIEKKIIDLLATMKGFDAVLQTLAKDLETRNLSLAGIQKQLKEQMSDRNRLFKQKNPDKEETFLETRVLEAEKSKNLAREKKNEAGQQLSWLKNRIADLKERTEKRVPELNHLESSFESRCKKTGFKDESAFISSRLSLDKRNQLQNRARSLDEKQADIEARKKDRVTRLSQEISKKMTDVPQDHLEKEQARILESLKMMGEEIGAIKQQLLDNKAAKLQLQKKTGLINAQKTELLRWDALHSLIGSADGKKYRNFAQGITFELMVSHANRQLEKMSDRYLLIRDENQPLELNIVDNYQAGEIRSTKNLSGGESFIVSLSLALGLSSMASRNVRVDSLFLDEGFGTLDEEALEISLEALAGLHQKGKLIGVISHVSALKERIRTQIAIVPVSGGRSKIMGPGCVEIN